MGLETTVQAVLAVGFEPERLSIHPRLGAYQRVHTGNLLHFRIGLGERIL
jgi:hypothetical protein